MIRIFLTLAIFLLVGCASTGRPFKPVKASGRDAALVYIYRPSGLMFKLRKPTISINGKELFDLPSNEYTWIELTPGTYRFTADWAWDTLLSDTTRSLTVESERTYYVRISSGGSFDGLFFSGGAAVPMTSGHATILIPREDRALAELKKCTLIEGLRLDERALGSLP
jgi:hypothetical protein